MHNNCDSQQAMASLPKNDFQFVPSLARAGVVSSCLQCGEHRVPDHPAYCDDGTQEVPRNPCPSDANYGCFVYKARHRENHCVIITDCFFYILESVIDFMKYGKENRFQICLFV